MTRITAAAFGVSREVALTLGAAPHCRVEGTTVRVGAAGTSCETDCPYGEVSRTMRDSDIPLIRHLQEARSPAVLCMDRAVCVLPPDCLLHLHNVFHLCVSGLAVCCAGLAGAGCILLAGFLPCDLAMGV
jgi:hypothetical protein